MMMSSSQKQRQTMSSLVGLSQWSGKDVPDSFQSFDDRSLSSFDFTAANKNEANDETEAGEKEKTSSSRGLKKRMTSIRNFAVAGVSSLTVTPANAVKSSIMDGVAFAVGTVLPGSKTSDAAHEGNNSKMSMPSSPATGTTVDDTASLSSSIHSSSPISPFKPFVRGDPTNTTTTVVLDSLSESQICRLMNDCGADEDTETCDDTEDHHFVFGGEAPRSVATPTSHQPSRSLLQLQDIHSRTTSEPALLSNKAKGVKFATTISTSTKSGALLREREELMTGGTKYATSLRNLTNAVDSLHSSSDHEFESKMDSYLSKVLEKNKEIASYVDKSPALSNMRANPSSGMTLDVEKDEKGDAQSIRLNLSSSSSFDSPTKNKKSSISAECNSVGSGSLSPPPSAPTLSQRMGSAANLDRFLSRKLSSNEESTDGTAKRVFGMLTGSHQKRRGKEKTSNVAAPVAADEKMNYHATDNFCPWEQQAAAAARNSALVDPQQQKPRRRERRASLSNLEQLKHDVRGDSTTAGAVKSMESDETRTVAAPPSSPTTHCSAHSRYSRKTTCTEEMTEPSSSGRKVVRSGSSVCSGVSSSNHSVRFADNEQSDELVATPSSKQAKRAVPSRRSPKPSPSKTRRSRGELESPRKGSEHSAASGVRGQRRGGDVGNGPRRRSRSPRQRRRRSMTNTGGSGQSDNTKRDIEVGPIAFASDEQEKVSDRKTVHATPTQMDYGYGGDEPGEQLLQRQGSKTRKTRRRSSMSDFRPRDVEDAEELGRNSSRSAACEAETSNTSPMDIQVAPRKDLPPADIPIVAESSRFSRKSSKTKKSSDGKKSSRSSSKSTVPTPSDPIPADSQGSGGQSWPPEKQRKQSRRSSMTDLVSDPYMEPGMKVSEASPHQDIELSPRPSVPEEPKTRASPRLRESPKLSRSTRKSSASSRDESVTRTISLVPSIPEQEPFGDLKSPSQSRGKPPRQRRRNSTSVSGGMDDSLNRQAERNFSGSSADSSDIIATASPLRASRRPSKAAPGTPPTSQRRRAKDSPRSDSKRGSSPERRRRTGSPNRSSQKAKRRQSASANSCMQIDLADAHIIQQDGTSVLVAPLGSLLPGQDVGAIKIVLPPESQENASPSDCPVSDTLHNGRASHPLDPDAAKDGDLDPPSLATAIERRSQNTSRDPPGLEPPGRRPVRVIEESTAKRGKERSGKSRRRMSLR